MKIHFSGYPSQVFSYDILKLLNTAVNDFKHIYFEAKTIIYHKRLFISACFLDTCTPYTSEMYS